MASMEMRRFHSGQRAVGVAQALGQAGGVAEDRALARLGVLGVGQPLEHVQPLGRALGAG